MSAATNLFYDRIHTYFGSGKVTVAETFSDTGWTSWNRYRKTVTPTWLRKLRTQGVTQVSLMCGTRQADFTITELLSTRTAR